MRTTRGLLRAATLLATAGMASAAAAAPATVPLLQHGQCRAASCRAAAGNDGAGGAAAAEQRWAVVRIAGDGRCLFRSLAQGSHVAVQEDTAAAAAGSLAAGGGGSSAASSIQLLPAQQETARADELRGSICQELLNRRDEFAFFIDEDFDAYVQRMRQPHVWGGEPELAVATHVLQRPIAVYMQGSPQLTLVSRYGDEQYGASGGKADVPLLFHGAGHYDLLVREEAAQQAKQPRSKL